MQLDHVRIGAHDEREARRLYGLLLGVEPTPLPDGGHRFQLARGAVELVGEPAGLHALGFVPGDAPWPEDFHGVDVRRAGVTEPSADATAAIDHVVVQTTEPERAIALWRDRVGLRLALDRSFPERGVRLLFFRTGGMTLEYASPLGAPAERDAPDRLYGVSYRVPDLAAHRTRLVDAGVDVSDVRPGMKPGTRVVTVRSGTAGVPTLLIEAAPA